MKKFVLSTLLVSMLFQSVAFATTTTTDAPISATKTVETKFKADQIESPKIDEFGAASYDNSGDNAKSRYFVNLDYYNMKSDDQLTIIEKFRTLQQTSEWSCGNAAALMVLNHFGKATGISELDIANAMKSSTDLDVKNALPGSADNFYEYGTDIKQMYEYFNTFKGLKVVESSYKAKYKDTDLLVESASVSGREIGNLTPTFSAMSLYTSENKDDSEAFVEDAKDSYFVKWLLNNIKNNRPVMVEWSDWNGHWQSIIGYDNNGTPTIGDDMLIFADPYDTSDHWQDGYYAYPLERWFYMWDDTHVAPKPYQLQQYLVVDIDKEQALPKK